MPKVEDGDQKTEHLLHGSNSSAIVNYPAEAAISQPYRNVGMAV